MTLSEFEKALAKLPVRHGPLSAVERAVCVDVEPHFLAKSIDLLQAPDVSKPGFFDDDTRQAEVSDAFYAVSKAEIDVAKDVDDNVPFNNFDAAVYYLARAVGDVELLHREFADPDPDVAVEAPGGIKAARIIAARCGVSLPTPSNAHT